MRTLSSILDTVNNFVQPFIDKGINILNGLPAWQTTIVVLVLAIFFLIGLFVFIKKFIKLFLVLAILGAIFYYVYSQGYLSSILGNTGWIGFNLLTTLI